MPEQNIPITCRRGLSTDHYAGNLHTEVVMTEQQMEHLARLLIEALPAARRELILADMAAEVAR